jgi:chromosome segregation ATPase
MQTDLEALRDSLNRTILYVKKFENLSVDYAELQNENLALKDNAVKLRKELDELKITLEAYRERFDKQSKKIAALTKENEERKGQFNYWHDEVNKCHRRLEEAKGLLCAVRNGDIQASKVDAFLATFALKSDEREKIIEQMERDAGVPEEYVGKQLCCEQEETVYEKLYAAGYRRVEGAR